jgi:crotonobetainyl-CoA:carnitine CoA-transferase CaiB-like acyl-CoA transferase
LSVQEQAPIRIVDLSINAMGGYATRMLAAYGAEVIKVETPGKGDPTRAIGPFPDGRDDPNSGATSLFLDCNKKSVTLDIRKAAGRGILDRLLADADVMVETFAPREADALELQYELLEKRFPRLVVTSITPFGKTGPYRDFEASQIVLEAMSGWLFQSGEPGFAPTRTRGELSTAMIPGLFAACGTLAALAWRAACGEGQLVEVAAMEAMLAASRYYETTYAYRGLMVTRLGTTLSPTYCYRPASDGWAALCATTDQQREILAHVMELSDHLDDPAFARPAPGANAASEVTALIDRWVAGRSRAEIFHLLQGMRVPSAYLTTADEVLTLEQLRERQAFVRIDHPAVDVLEFPATPFKMGVTPLRTGRAPLVGEHNGEIYEGRLGIGADELRRLEREGIV